MSLRFALVLAAWSGALPVAALPLAGTAEPPAELIVTGADVLTLDPATPRAQAVAVRDGRIVAVGSRAAVEAWRGPDTRMLTLSGGLVVPGLTDAHVHVEQLGMALEQLDLTGTGSLEEVLSLLAARAAQTGEDEWLLGAGWDQNDWPEQRFPSAADLDRVAGSRPVLLDRIDRHAAWASSRALELAGVTADTPDPSGGRLLRDAAGRPTGILLDAAVGLVSAHVPAPDRQTRKRRLAAGLREAARVGLTEVHDAGVDLETVALYEELLAEGPLPARVYVMIEAPEAFLSAPDLEPRTGLGDGQLSVRAVKVVADGALGSRGAWLLAPYSDEPGTRGLRTVEPEAFERVIRAALARGFQVDTHAIGDAANRFVLDAYERGFGEAGGAERRFRVEHAQVIAPQDVLRFARLGVIPSMQPTHCTSDMYWATDRLGPERARGAYLWRAFVEQGVPIAAGSDAPVERIDVLPGLYAAVTRQDAQGWPEGGWHPEQRVDVVEALRMFSEHAAFAAFEEHDRGRIAPGFRADLTVFDRDLTALPPAELLRSSAVLSMVGGRITHDARSR